MANPNKTPDENDPLRRSATPGEPQDSLEASQNTGWRERYPGWETIHGKPNDPRFMSNVNPDDDPRFSTNLKTSATLPRSAGLAFWVRLLFMGIILMALMGFAFYLRYPKKVPRSPEQTMMRVHPEPVWAVNRVVADSLLPLRAVHSMQR